MLEDTRFDQIEITDNGVGLIKINGTEIRYVKEYSIKRKPYDELSEITLTLYYDPTAHILKPKEKTENE